MSEEIYDLIVIGSGPAGLTAGLYAHRSGLKVMILGGDSPGGQVMRHYRIDNYPGFPGGITGAELMARWLQQTIDEIGSAPEPQHVTGINISDPTKQITTDDNKYRSLSVIIATGSAPRRLSAKRVVDFEGRGIFYCASCDGPLLRTMSSRHAAVIGGGDTAFHTAIALLPHADMVTLIMRGYQPTAKLALQKRLKQEPKIRILTQRFVKAVSGEKTINGLILENVKTKETENFEVNAVFVGIGQIPVTDFLNGSLELTAEGFILTDANLMTSTPGVFAAGDVRATKMRQVVTAAADGALAAQSAAEYVRFHSGHPS